MIVGQKAESKADIKADIMWKGVISFNKKLEIKAKKSDWGS